MALRPNPLSERFLGRVRISDTELSSLIDEVTVADSDRQGWVDYQARLQRLRYGRRRQRTFPWPNASNLHVPIIDRAIRKRKPLFFKLIAEADPVVEFVGEDPAAVDAERLAEAAYTWVFRTLSNGVEETLVAIDIMEQFGFAVIQAAWEYRTEPQTRIVNVAQLFPDPSIRSDQETVLQVLAQQYDFNPSIIPAPEVDRVLEQIANGAPFVRLKNRVVVRDRPILLAHEPTNIIVPPRTTDIADARFVCVQHRVSIRDIAQREADGFFPRGTVDKLSDFLERERTRRPQPGEPPPTDSFGLARISYERDTIERIQGSEEPDSILVWEVYHWADTDGDSLPERVVSWIHPLSRTLLTSFDYPYPFASWPFTRLESEVTSKRWYSPRGTAARLESLQREVTAQHNARIDSMTLRNAPVFQYPTLAGVTPPRIRFVPGTFIPVPPGAEIRPLVQDRGAHIDYRAEEDLLSRFAEDYAGTLDFAFAGAQPRTATEVQANLQFATTVASLDAALFQLRMKRVHEQLWALFLEFGPDEFSARILGPQDTIPLTRLVRKADIARNFTLFPTGSIASTNRALELAHAREALQLLVNDQSGFINPFELRRWYISLLDFRAARRILNGPDQARELQILRQAAQEVQDNPEVQAALAGGVFNVPPEQAERQRFEFLPRRQGPLPT